MGIEQLDNERRSEDKQRKNEEEKKQDFFESQKLKAETSNLLQKLASQIAEEFGIDISQVRELISSGTTGNLEDLKSGVLSTETINFGDLQNAINRAKNKIAELSKNKIESLKNSLSKNTYNPESHEYFTSKKILSERLLQKAYYPQNFGDQIIGAGVGIFDSSEAVILFVYGLGKGILLTPYHIYLIITGQSSYDWKAKI